MRVCVVGLGKIGLPLAVQFASKGHQTIGADKSPDVVASVLAGEPPFPGEADLEVRLRVVLAEGALSARPDTASAVAESEVVVVVVPLVIGPDRTPDFAALDAASTDVGRGLTSGCLVSYETTLPVGTTRGRFVPALEAASGLVSGRDLFVCHSPERVFSGRIFADLRRYPKLVGACDAEAGRRAVAFYEAALEFDDRPDLARPNGVWDLGSAEAAELAKLAETTYRDINIAFANELAVAAEGLGIDVGVVIEASNSQPFSHIHRPGIAVGGHCIPVYPHLLMSSVAGFEVPDTARAVNERMPRHAVESVDAALGGLDGRTVAVLGLAYRGGVKEDAFSGAYSVVDELERRGASAPVHDPLYDDAELEARGLQPFQLGSSCDAAIIQADHDEYRRLGAADLPGCQVLYDGRGMMDPSGAAVPKVLRLGAR